ncbi:unnamed protein product [Lasius platythorax]|uniref:Uncharacterized protein n=1 Tax=Lasius platythorax TaxID=488582 RepID=A0AAV2N5N0_9HYME
MRSLSNENLSSKGFSSEECTNQRHTFQKARVTVRTRSAAFRGRALLYLAQEKSLPSPDNDSPPPPASLSRLLFSIRRVTIRYRRCHRHRNRRFESHQRLHIV